MFKDPFGNIIYQEKDLFDLMYQGKLNILKTILVERTKETERISGLNYYEKSSQTLENFDLEHKSIWFIPEEYKNLDIESYILNLCAPWDPEHTRVQEELSEFKKRDMLDLLKWLKYFVDVARSNKIVWGVGRGSSVASYVLYLLGVHKINSIKHNLDYREFFR